MIRPGAPSPIARNKPFVVISGLPGSGKSTLARRLAPLVKLPVIDKDDILERLFEAKGVGDRAWRRALSRESDDRFQAEAFNAEGALLVSFWHLPGMATDSGTPTEWLPELSGRVLNVHCTCAPEIAADRVFQRRRHPGHLDSSSKDEILISIRAIAHLSPLEIGPRIEVETSHGLPELGAVVEEILSLTTMRK
jgi:AAA domain